MKFKSFLKGVGVGILFASIIFLIAYVQFGNKKMTDAQIRERAKQLGMVEQTTSIKDLLGSETQERDTSETADTDSETSSENPKNSEGETQTEEETTETVTEETTESEKETVSITIERGSTSYTVCQTLKEMGMIEDAAQFDNYLIEKGYASRIRVGTHSLTKGMDFHAIAEAISDPL